MTPARPLLETTRSTLRVQLIMAAVIVTTVTTAQLQARSPRGSPTPYADQTTSPHPYPDQTTSPHPYPDQTTSPHPYPDQAKSPHSYQLGPEVDCPTQECRCEAQPFSSRLDLHCPRATRSLPTLAENALTFEWVYIVDARSLSLHRKSFNNLRTRRLSLAGSQLTVKGWGLLELRGVLEELVLARCGLQEVPCRALQLPLLQTLELSGNQLQQVSRHCLTGLPALTALSLRHNLLTTVTPGALHGLSRLHQLTLADNHLTTISRGTLRGASALLKLDLTNNRISTLEVAAFRPVRRLEELTLAGNKLRVLRVGHLKGLRHLRTLDLTGNPVVAIEAGTFHPARRLRHLSVDMAGVKEANNVTFRGLRALRSLQLYELGRPSLPLGFLGDCGHLERLAFTSYETAFKGLGSESFSEQLKLGRLEVEVSPLYDCSCNIPWIRRLTGEGARVKGHCYTVSQLSCARFSSN